MYIHSQNKDIGGIMEQIQGVKCERYSRSEIWYSEDKLNSISGVTEIKERYILGRGYGTE